MYTNSKFIYIYFKVLLFQYLISLKSSKYIFDSLYKFEKFEKNYSLIIITIKHLG